MIIHYYRLPEPAVRSIQNMIGLGRDWPCCITNGDSPPYEADYYIAVTRGWLRKQKYLVKMCYEWEYCIAMQTILALRQGGCGMTFTVKLLVEEVNFLRLEFPEQPGWDELLDLVTEVEALNTIVTASTHSQYGG